MSSPRRGSRLAASGTVAAALAAVSLSGPVSNAAPAPAPLGDLQLVGSDAFVISDDPGGWSSSPTPVPLANSTGYALLGRVSGYALDSYTIRLVDSPGIERLRHDVERGAAEIARETGLRISVEAGVVPDRDEVPGEVLVRVATNSPCGQLSMPGIAGCGGPRTLGGLITSGDVSIAVQGPCETTGGSVVAHELGHVFGLAHYSLEHDGLLQLMHPSTVSNAPSFRSGDRIGLRVLAGTSILVSMLDRPSAAAGPGATVPSSTTPAAPAPVAPAIATTDQGSWFSQPTVQRVLDTRVGLGLNGAFGGGSVRRLDLTPFVGSAAVDAVVLNLTATGTEATGYVTAFPGGTALPPTSNVNYVAGRDTANLVMIKVGAGNTVDLAVQGGATHLVADLVGVFSATGTSGFVAATPARVLDTRESNVAGETGLPLGCEDYERVDLARLRAAGVPVENATAEIVNLTAVDTNAAGFVSLRPRSDLPRAGEISPTSAVNPEADDTRANLAITPGATWLVHLSASLRSHVIADLAGWFVPPERDPQSARFLPIAPERVLDTRIGLGLSGRFTTAAPRRLDVPLPASVSPDQVTAVVLNLTVAGPESGGYLTAYPAGGAPPNASNVNFDAGETAPNLAVVKLGPEHDVDLVVPSGAPHVIADVLGYFVRP